MTGLVLRLVQFASSGGICYLVSILTLWLGTDRLGMHYLLSSLLAFLMTTPLGFWLNTSGAFRQRSQASQRQLATYTLIVVASLLINMLLMWLLVEQAGTHYLFANILVTGVMLVANFGAHSMWTFRNGAAPVPSANPE